MSFSLLGENGNVLSRVTTDPFEVRDKAPDSVKIETATEIKMEVTPVKRLLKTEEKTPKKPRRESLEKGENVVGNKNCSYVC
jgi:hypothetical protein